ncbi:MAG: hypothetical protein N3A66_11005, partial [Planctomycetota bacterium]|nr:hypothetical protein [Planctomycetota bacterium]
MNQIIKKRFPAAIALAAFLAADAAFAAEPLTISLKDWTGRGFPPDLVNYTIEMPKDSGKNLRVLDAAGKMVPVQVMPAKDGTATLAFVAEIAPGGTSTYTLRNNGQGPAAPAAVSATRDGEVLVLANQSLAIKTPAPQEKSFEPPIAADSLPAPLLAFRGPDGIWKGEGKILHKRPVKKFAVAQGADGPVFVEIRYRLDYAEGGYYQATIRVIDRLPFALVREEYDLGLETDTDFSDYLLNYAHGGSVPGTAYGVSPFFRNSTATADE